MSAKITDQIAHLCSDGCILMNNQILQVVVDVCVMNIFIKVFRNSSQLRDQTKCIYDNDGIVVVSKKAILIDDSKSIGLDELLCKLLAAFSAEH